MKYLSLVWSGVWRHPVRTGLTLLSAITAFFLYGMLEGVNTSIQNLIGGMHADRIIVSNPALLPLPMAYRRTVAAVPGVDGVTFTTAAEGYYRNTQNRIRVFAVDAESYFPLYPDTIASAADKAALARSKSGALIANFLAKKYNWKRGDRISLHLNSLPQKTGSVDWVFTVVGFLDYQMAPDSALVLINHAYLDAARLVGSGTTQFYFVHVRDPATAGTIGRDIDARFVNSPVQTRSQSEKDYAETEMTKFGDIGAFVVAIIAASFFTLLMLVANALMRSFRERIREFAVLKALGFSDHALAAIVGGEAMVLCLLAAVIGLGAAWRVLPLLSAATGGILPVHIPLSVLGLGALAAVVLAAVSAGIPAWRAMRLSVVDALGDH